VVKGTDNIQYAGKEPKQTQQMILLMVHLDWAKGAAIRDLERILCKYGARAFLPECVVKQVPCGVCGL
jgi:hypothetical protein